MAHPICRANEVMQQNIFYASMSTKTKILGVVNPLMHQISQLNDITSCSCTYPLIIPATKPSAFDRRKKQKTWQDLP
jgi:hypothetical protein